MEKFIIISGSLVIPSVIIATLVLVKRAIKRREEMQRAQQAQDSQLISVLENLVQVKDDHIRKLKI